MKVVWSAVVSAVVVAGGAPVSAQEFEPLPTLRAADVLPAELLEGPHHKVEDEVVSDGVSLAFQIRSTFGDFTAPSREMAELRIAEIAAIARLKELGKLYRQE